MAIRDLIPWHRRRDVTVRRGGEYALVVSTTLIFGFSLAIGAWVPSYAAQPDSTKKAKTTVKHKKTLPQNAIPQNATKPQGTVTQPEVQRGY
jgi:hypothetical protein